MVLAYTNPLRKASHDCLRIRDQHPVDDALFRQQYAYSHWGRGHTGDVNERAKLNSFVYSGQRAQFIVGGFTLTLVANSPAPNKQATRLANDDGDLGRPVLVRFHYFRYRRERIEPSGQKTPPKQDFAICSRTIPWKVMFA